MEKLNFYSEKKSELFLKSTFKSICFLGACTAHDLASGIEYFSNYNITTYAPYQTIFNAPSLLKDLEIVSHSLKHKVIIDSQLKLFTDEIRFWNTSNNVNEVIEKNKQIDEEVVKNIVNSDLVVVSLGSVEMWKKSNRVLNKLPKDQFYNTEIVNVYLTAEDLVSIAQDIIKCIHSINPSSSIQFSIPYVLLKASEKFSNLHLATTENYRIMKNAIMELGTEYYFPEYELFKFYIEKNKINFQQDKRHPSVELIADVSKHIVREIDKSLLSKTPSERFSINKVNTRGKIYGKDYL